MAAREVKLVTRWGQLTQEEFEQMEAIMALPPKPVAKDLIELFSPENLAKYGKAPDTDLPPIDPMELIDPQANLTQKEREQVDRDVRESIRIAIEED